MSMPNRNLGFLSTVEISFLITPAVPAAVFSGALTLSWSPKTVSDGASLFGLLFLIAYVVAGAHTLILGVPAFLLGKWLNTIHWWTCAPVAFVIGGLPMAIFGQVGWLAFPTWGLFGAIGVLAFWLLWRFYVRSEKPAANASC
jgi:hypothetical protein